MTNLICPSCNAQLFRTMTSGKLQWNCQSCQGVLIGYAPFRLRTSLEALQSICNSKDSQSDSICPFCKFHLRGAKTGLEFLPNVEFCSNCQMIWIESGRLPADKTSSTPTAKIRGPTEQLDPRLQKAYAQAVLKMAPGTKKSQMSNYIQEGLPDVSYMQLLPALVGLPVKTEPIPLSRKPFVTYALILACFVVFIAHEANLQLGVDRLGFLPLEPFRQYGKSIITSFFMHGSWLHILGNMYFLYLFGEETEDKIGPANFFILVFLSHAFGVYLHSINTKQPDLPLIGASAGVYGIMAIYLMRFPKARVSYVFRYFFRFVTITVPIWISLGTNILFEYYLARNPCDTESAVAHYGHVGGAIVGLTAGFIIRLIDSHKK